MVAFSASHLPLSTSLHAVYVLHERISDDVRKMFGSAGFGADCVVFWESALCFRPEE